MAKTMEAGNGIAYFASVLGFLGLVSSFLPQNSLAAIELLFYRLVSRFTFYVELYISEYTRGDINLLYEDAVVYVASLVQDSSANYLNLSLVKKVAKPTYSLSGKDRVTDEFEGATFWWSHQATQMPSSLFWNPHNNENRYFSLSFHRRFRKSVLPKYITAISERAKVLRHQNQQKLLFTNTRNGSDSLYRSPKLWKSVAFEHPATFQTMAMEPKLKNKLEEDLKTFMNSEKFYRQVGRAWKRGFLLHGPPGTGKSSLIAAIANFTGYDIYDLELTEVSSNAELRKLLMQVSSKSIIVIEDIDCSIELKNRGKPATPAEPEEQTPDKEDRKKKNEKPSKVTLSGLLNFTDGLWSSCGNERIVIFTTNFIDKIDPALIRSGRMDLHIEMTFCSFEAFKVLAWTHLGIEKHDKYEEIQELFGDPEVAPISPADVAEVLIQNRASGANLTLECVVEALKDPKRKAPLENDRAKEEDSEASRVLEPSIN